MALLSGRIQFFDLNTPNGARQAYSLALEAAQEGGDEQLAAAVLGHMSFVSAAGHRSRAAIDQLTAAGQHTTKQPSRVMDGWLAAVEAELLAKDGELDGSLRALDRATDRLSRGGGEDPAWLDWFSSTRLDGFAGYTHLNLRRWADAEAALTRALDAEPAAGKQRSVFLADLATVHIGQGDLDGACALAGQALEVASRSGYETGMQRVRQVHGMMQPWASAPLVREFKEQLALTDA
jgi:tetratricopeptide (TPR) repeat protein